MIFINMQVRKTKRLGFLRGDNHQMTSPALSEMSAKLLLKTTPILLFELEPR